MSAVKRHLEAMTDEVLDSVRITGAAVLVEREPLKQPATFCSAPESTLKKALEISAEWLAGPANDRRAKLDAMERELREWEAGPPADLLIAYFDSLQELVDEFVAVLNEWMEPYELRAGWSEGALIVKRERDWS